MLSFEEYQPFILCVCSLGVAIAERLAPFKVKKFIYTDVAPRPDLAKAINAEYGKTWSTQLPHSTFQMRWDNKIFRGV